MVMIIKASNTNATGVKNNDPNKAVNTLPVRHLRISHHTPESVNILINSFDLMLIL